MPFSFFEAAFDAIDLADFADFADLGSLVDDFGSEFLDASSSFLTDFNVPFGDVASLGGWDQIGSFAGDASWFDSFNPGAILDSIPSVSDFNISSFTNSLPSLSSIKDVASTVSNNIGSVVKTVQSGVAAYQKVAPAVNAVSSALGIQNPINQIIQPLNQVLGVAGSAAGIANKVASGTDTLANLQTKATSFFSSDPNVAKAIDKATGLPINTPREVSDDPFEQRRLDNIAEETVGPTEAAVVEQLSLTDRLSLGANNIASSFKGVVADYPGLTGAVSKATGIPVAKATSLFTTIPTAANAIDKATGLPINTARAVDQYGLGLLTDQEATALLKKAPLVNSLVDPQVPTVDTYPEAEASRNDLLASKREYEIAIASYEREIANSNKNIEEIQANLQDPDLSPAQRATLEAQIRANQDAIALNTDNLLSGTSVLDGINSNLETDQQIITSTNSSAVSNPGGVPTSSVPGVSGSGLSISNIISNPGAVLASVVPGVGVNAVTAQQAALQNAGTNIQNLVAQARQQQELRNQRQNKAQSTDWRVRLRLAPNSNYLYNAKEPGLLAPLASSNGTDGVIFPYTPAIDTAYKANYETYDLTHSNFRGYFYKNSSVDVVNIRAQFTAQDTNEADYLLAVIHFFRSVTKMFYGQDPLRGSPPPLVYLSGYGVSQFNEHPCVVSQFNYSLPTDVDYIRAGTTLSNGTNLLPNRTRQPNPTNPLSYSINRLLNNGLTLGALAERPTEINGLDVNSVSYVPTKMEISIALLPIQSRSQVSKQFSLQGFSNGNLLRAGYW